VIMENVAANIQALSEMRKLGVSVAIDDFGTGYSSLAYLTRLPIQTLKIDRAFVASMFDDTNAMTLVSTIVTLAHSLGLSVVAEGVETEQQQRVLDELHCDLIQGYRISKPVNVEAIEALVAPGPPVAPVALSLVRQEGDGIRRSAGGGRRNVHEVGASLSRCAPLSQA